VQRQHVQGGVSDQRRVAFRPNLAEMLNQVQYRHDTILIKKDRKPVAALLDGHLFERIEAGYAAMPETKGLAEIDAAVADTRSYPVGVPGKLIAAWRHGALYVVLSATILNEPWRVLPKLALQVDLVEREAGDEPGFLPNFNALL
jgi:PHD/YefM family antitoxin component YafN of YafNO toxin-antitoxin module